MRMYIGMGMGSRPRHRPRRADQRLQHARHALRVARTYVALRHCDGAPRVVPVQLQQRENGVYGSYPDGDTLLSTLRENALPGWW